MGFFLEVVIGGLMAGVLYSLVALGFVLIYKASGVFNFAQGAMVLFAALSLVAACRKTCRFAVRRLFATLADHDCAGDGNRALGAATAGQPGRHHAYSWRPRA